MDITCQHCGLCDDYYVKKSGPHNSAYCNGCGNYIKHLPQNNEIKIVPFGKYKGREISSMRSDEELRYLQWFVEMPNLRDNVKISINKHLLSL